MARSKGDLMALRGAQPRPRAARDHGGARDRPPDDAHGRGRQPDHRRRPHGARRRRGVRRPRDEARAPRLRGRRPSVRVDDRVASADAELGLRQAPERPRQLHRAAGPVLHGPDREHGLLRGARAPGVLASGRLGAARPVLRARRRRPDPALREHGSRARPALRARLLVPGRRRALPRARRRPDLVRDRRGGRDAPELRQSRHSEREEDGRMGCADRAHPLLRSPRTTRWSCGKGPRPCAR